MKFIQEKIDKMKVYTKTGDEGETFVPTYGKVKKDELIVEAVGVLDELNAWIGRITDKGQDDTLFNMSIQSRLFDIGYEITAKDPSVVIAEEHVEEMEKLIDEMDEQIPQLKNFILPIAGSDYHYARAICRRAERRVFTVVKYNLERFKLCLMYLNRLSDYLFTRARFIGYRQSKEDHLWKLHT